MKHRRFPFIAYVVGRNASKPRPTRRRIPTIRLSIYRVWVRLEFNDYRGSAWNSAFWVYSNSSIIYVALLD